MEQEDTQKLPKIRGKSEYAYFLDRARLSTFLLERGMKQSDIEQLEVVIQKKSIVGRGGVSAVYNRRKRTIIVTTRDFLYSFRSYTKNAQNDILWELNASLVFCLSQVLDMTDKRKDYWCLFQLCFAGLFFGGFSWFIAVSFFRCFSLSFAFPLFFVWLFFEVWVFPKWMALVNPYERRARTFEKTYRDGVVLFKRRETGTRLWA